MRKRGLCCRPVSVRSSVTLVYSIHTAEDIVKLLSPPGSPITLVFWSRRRYPIPRGTPSVGRKIHGVGKFPIFDRNRRLSRIRYEIGPWLLLKAYRKSYALYRMMTFSMTFTDHYSGFQGHGIFMSNISMTLSDLWVWPGIQGHNIVWSWISEKRRDLGTKLL